MNMEPLACQMSTRSFLNSWFSPIDKLMIWRGNWMKYDHKTSNLFLRVCYEQLLITADTKLLESFNMHQKIKGIFRDDILILIVKNNNNEIRKIKFQVKLNLEQCLQALARHFPVVNHKLMRSNQAYKSKYRNIDEVLKYALERRDDTDSNNLPTDFESFIKLCLLDPSFPQIVLKTEEILNNKIIKK